MNHPSDFTAFFTPRPALIALFHESHHAQVTPVRYNGHRGNERHHRTGCRDGLAAASWRRAPSPLGAKGVVVVA